MQFYDTVTLPKHLGVILHQYHTSPSDAIYVAGTCANTETPITLELLEDVLCGLEKHWKEVEKDIQNNGGSYEDSDVEQLINLMHDLEFILFCVQEENKDEVTDILI